MELTIDDRPRTMDDRQLYLLNYRQLPERQIASTLHSGLWSVVCGLKRLTQWEDEMGTQEKSRSMQYCIL